MILGFKQEFPWGGETKFWQKIIASVQSEENPTSKPGNMFAYLHPKLHTIREGNRWKPGDLIHMATGVRSKNYNQFNKDIPELQRVKSVQRIDIIHRGPGCALIFIDRKLFYSSIIYIDYKGTNIDRRKEFRRAEFLEFIRNDGLDSEDQFWEWFRKPLRNGQIIHWTDLKY